MSLAGYKHLCETFAHAERMHPDLMERYSGQLGEEIDAGERMRIMWRGLRETFRQRYPMPDGFYDRNSGGSEAA